MKVPPKRKGNSCANHPPPCKIPASMKVPPKRKGNLPMLQPIGHYRQRLNESPSEKEGKCFRPLKALAPAFGASMKVPPKRKGNAPHASTPQPQRDPPQ